MEAIAKGKYLRTSTNRMRQVADMVRGKPVDVALGILHGLGLKKKSARMVDAVLKSAVANFNTVDAGPLIKRIRAHAQGRANRIEKKLSHLTVVVSD